MVEGLLGGPRSPGFYVKLDITLRSFCSLTLKLNLGSSNNTTIEEDDEIRKKTTIKIYLFTHIIKALLKGPIGSIFM